MRLSALLLIVALGCAATPRSAGRAPDDSWVLLDPAAPLFSEPAEGAPSVTAAPSELAALRLRAQGEYRLYRLLRDAGDWLEVETPGPVDDQCTDPAPELLSLRLRLFARAADAVRVTTRRVRASFDDGTSATLLAGVPLSSEGVAFPGELALRLEIPPDAAGRWFVGGGRLDTSGRERFLPGERLNMLSVGGAPLRPLPDEGGVRGPGVYQARTVPAGMLLLVRTRCAELLALGGSELVKPIPKAAGSPSENPPALKPPVPPIGRAGAAIYWPSGRAAGELRRELELADETSVSGARRCFRWAPPRKHGDGDGDGEGRLTLCFDAQAIR